MVPDCPKFDKKIAVEQPPAGGIVHAIRVWYQPVDWCIALHRAESASPSNRLRIFRVTHGGVGLSLALLLKN